jgi:S1-C subfamily serine protease
LPITTPVEAGGIRSGGTQGVTPGSSSDLISDFGLGVNGTFIGGTGVQVDSVDAGSPAERVGLEQGDVILDVDSIAVTNPNSWIKAMEKKNRVRLRIRNGRDPGGPVVFRDVNLT